MSDGEFATAELLRRSHLAAQHELPRLFAASAASIGVTDAVVYLADLQQQTLVPFLGEIGPGTSRAVEPLAVDGTIAGRTFQHLDVLEQVRDADGVRVWLPLLNGTERLGVLAVAVDAAQIEAVRAGVLGRRLHLFAALVAEIITTKTSYGDTIVQLRRRTEMGLASELQWSLLPPLTFACHDVTVAGALEPAYRVAGDTLDYAVDRGLARAAVFDGMGHGLRSCQLATVAVAAYRNSRRSGLSLLDTTVAIHAALVEAFGGALFATGLLAELDTETGVLTWISAGHPEPLLFRNGRLVKLLSCRPAPPLGLELPPDIAPRSFTVCQEFLEPGDRVLLYTDGVTEARAPGGDFFGEQRLADLLTRNFAADLPTPETMRRVVRSLLAHQQGQLNDDATLLLLEWRAEVRSMLPGPNPQ